MSWTGGARHASIVLLLDGPLRTRTDATTAPGSSAEQAYACLHARGVSEFQGWGKILQPGSQYLVDDNTNTSTASSSVQGCRRKRRWRRRRPCRREAAKRPATSSAGRRVVVVGPAGAHTRDVPQVLQKRTFTRYMNSKLKCRGIVVNDLYEDLKSGIVLYNFLEASWDSNRAEIF